MSDKVETLSQALRKISKLKGKHKDLMERAGRSVTFDEVNPPAFSFTACVEAAAVVSEELIRYETALRFTNAITFIEYVKAEGEVVEKTKKMTLAEATCRLQAAKGMIAWAKAIPPVANRSTKVREQIYDDTQAKYVMVEKVTICEFPEADKVKVIADWQDGFDKLNDLVESANHRTILQYPVPK